MANQILKYPYRPNMTVEILFQEAVRVKVNQQEVLDFPLMTARYLRFDGGLVSAKLNVLTLRNCTGSITVQPGVGVIPRILVRSVNGGERELEARNVTKIEMQSDGIRIHFRDNSQPHTGSTHTGGNSSSDDIPNFSTTSGGSGAPDPSRALKLQLQEKEEKIRELEQKVREQEASLKAARKQFQDVEAQRDQLQEALRTEVNRLQAMAKAAQSTGDRGLVDIIRQIEQLQQETDDREALVQQKQQELQAQKQASEQTKAQLEELERQLGAIRSQQEVRELDCQQAEKDLAELKQRLEMNQDIVELTESRFLKNNSVADTLKEMQKMIEAAEERIAFILKAREKFDHVVQDAVLLSGDGSVSSLDETGWFPPYSGGNEG